MRRAVFILIFLFSCLVLAAQNKDTLEITFGRVQGNDTIIHKDLKTVVIFPEKKFTNNRQRRRYTRYILKVKKVYPLALEARELLKEYEPKYYALEDQRDRRKLMKQVEKELFDQHKEELKKWSISDGRILLKLINRETNRTPYSLIQDFRGDFSAAFWQGIARIFKNDLKEGYNPDDEDKILEEVVRMIEAGYL